MKKIIVKKYGDPENLIVEEFKSIKTKQDIVKIKVTAAGVNYADILLAKGRYQERPRPPFSPGLEISGTVLEIGPEVKKFKEGDKVMAIMKYGGYTQEALIPEENVYPIPDNMDLKIAAGFPVVYGTAYAALVWKAKIKRNQLCLILGASGGVGLASIEIAKAKGSKVIAAAGSDQKLLDCKKHGADYLINYNKNNIKQLLKSLSKYNNGIDIVIDLIGGNNAIDSIKNLSWNGKIVIVGFASGKIPSIPANRLLLKNAEALGLYWGELAYREPELIGSSFREMGKWFSNGKLNPVITKELNLSQAGDALLLLKDRKVSGKIILAC